MLKRGDEGGEIRVNGACLVALGSGALLWPERQTLIVADLHFEKGASFAKAGALLPPYDTRAGLFRLEAEIMRWRPERVISLGDAFHRAGADAEMDTRDAAQLEALTHAAHWTWILGNHDPAPPARFGGDAVTEVRVGPLVFRHEPAPADAIGEIAGHLHPCARVRTDVGGQRRRCFVTDGERLIVPAFGAYAGGLNVLEPPIRNLLGPIAVHALGRRGVYRFAESQLAPDPGFAVRLSA